MNSESSFFDDMPPDPLERRRLKKQWQWLVVPPEVFELWYNDQVNGNEVLLLLLIQALVSKDRGCFATNAWLGEKCGYSPRRISGMISNLKEKGLIIQTKDQPRELETCWSRHSVEGGQLRPAPHVNSDVPCNIKRKTIQTVRGGTSDVEVGEMGFFEEHEPVEVNGQQTEYAMQLKEALQNEGKLQGKFSLKSWARQFGILERQVGQERLTKALEWYTDHIGEPFVPQAFAGESFKRKFVAIEAAMARDLGEEEEEVIELNDHCKNLLVRLTRVQWPKGSTAQLPKVLKASYENYVTLQAGLRYMSEEGDSRSARLAARVLDHHLRLDFLYHWFSDVWNQIEGWDDWSGNLWTYRFHRGSKRLKSMGREWIGSYTGRPEEWDAMMEEYVEGSKA